VQCDSVQIRRGSPLLNPTPSPKEDSLMQPDSLPEGKSLGTWDQLKIILHKTWVLKTRSIDDLALECCAPFFSILIASFLIFAGESNSYEVESFYPSSVRTRSIATGRSLCTERDL
jgi:hypothetical protein